MDMDSIKAKNGYRVCKINPDGQLFALATWSFTEEECTHLRAVLDGDHIIMVACLIPFDQFRHEQDNNECFHYCERFTTCKGNQYIYWRDEETDTDYITRINI